MCIKRPNAFDAVHAAFEYRFPIDRLIQRFKFDGDLAIGAWLAHRLADRVASARRPTSSWSRRFRGRPRRRGFNQAVEIARILSSRLGPRLERAALAKVRDTERSTRWTRARAARTFAARSPAACTCRRVGGDRRRRGDHRGHRRRAAAELLRAGAGRVSVWAVARTP
jgi:predicted amidophosphoribosyltransferase